MSGNKMDKSALSEIKVADFTQAIAGPLVSMTLAHYGAVVVRVESSIAPDVMRTWSPFRDGVVGLNRSGIFPVYNTSKYSLSLNLKHSRSREVTRRLIAWADVVLENFSPGTMQDLRLGYEDAIKINPNIVYLSLSMQGQTGPHSKLPGAGPQVASLSGFTFLCGWPDRIPSHIYPAYSDFVTPHYATSILLAALDYVKKTGKGQYIDVSMYETSLQFLAPVILDYTVNCREATRMGNRCSYSVPHGVFPCKGKERWCALAVFTDDEWARLCEVMGNKKLAVDPRFCTLLARKRNEEEVEQIVGNWTKKLAAEEVMERLQKMCIAAGVVATAEDIDKDPQLKHRQHYCEVDQGEAGKLKVEALPFRLSELSYEVRPAPSLGEHTEHVCKELLGMSEEEFIKLLTEDVFGY